MESSSNNVSGLDSIVKQPILPIKRIAKPTELSTEEEEEEDQRLESKRTTKLKEAVLGESLN